MQVDFMIIGAQKSGTTTLCSQLAQHPDICFSNPKEPMFFSRRPDWRAALPEYEALFDPAPGQRLGEGSTEYTMLPQSIGTAERLHEYNPGLRLVYIMRDPLERLRSHVAHRFLRRTATGDAAATVRDQPDVVLRSLYSVQLRPYLDVFPRDQLLPLVLEEHVTDPKRSLGRIGTFLDVDPSRFADRAPIVENASVGRRVVSDRTARNLDHPVVRAVRRRTPSSLRSVGRRALSRRLDAEPDLDAAMEQQLRRILSPEVDFVEHLLCRQIPSWRRRT